MEFAYEHIKKGNKKLLIIFNDMLKIGLHKTFSPYNKIIDIFTDYDLLFIKDKDRHEWYLIIYEEVKQLIEKVTSEYNYVFGLASSSGALCLLNILEGIKNHKKSVIVNGQINLTHNFVKIYEKTDDCAIFNFDKVNNIAKNILKKEINNELLTPIDLIIKNNNLEKYIFYCNNSCSDFVYHSYLSTLFNEKIKETNLFLNTDKLHNHCGYIKHCFSDEYFFKQMKENFDATIRSQV